jgi:hypothetical protein
MGPGSIDRLHLADNALFKIESALPPSKYFRYGRFAFERIESCVPDRPKLQVNFALSTR